MKNQKEIDQSLHDQTVFLRDLVERYVRNWKWFLLGVLLTSISTFLVLRFIPRLYDAKSSIKIKDDSSNGAISELAVFEDMGMLMNQKSAVENEMEVIESRELLEKVALDLNLNVKYTLKGKSFIEDISSLFRGNPSSKELYKIHPIEINFLIPDSLLIQKNAVFEIQIVSNDKFNFTELDKSQKNQFFGNALETSIGEIVVTPLIADGLGNYIGETIIVEIKPVRYVINYLKSNIDISNIKKTDILNLNVKTTSSQKSIDILNYLILHYNNDAVHEKNLISENTSEFISNRLNIVADELSEVDQNIESFRTENNIIDIESQAGLNLQIDTENQKQLTAARNQMSMVLAVEEYIQNQTEISILPENLGFSDAALTSSIKKYNELVIRRNEMLKGANAAHPVIVNLESQIESLKTTILQGIVNLKRSIQITIDGLISQDDAIDSQLFSAPKQQRELIDIRRQQEVKEALYLYLLQKREEIAITLGISTVNAKVIDAAHSSGFPVFPNKTMFMTFAVIVGLLIPFLVIYVSDLLDTKVHSRADIEHLVNNVPIVGEIPYTGKKKRIISKDDNSGLAEAFRLVRTNLDFMLTGVESSSKVVMITSSVGSEGKTFISVNLAKILAASGNRVLLLGMDLRAPSITKKINIKKGKGVTHFITDSDIQLNSIIQPFPDADNLDLLLSGIVPPNPAELLMNERVATLFEEVRKIYDYILVDTSPLSLVTDTLILNKYADMFVYVVRAEFMDKRSLGILQSMYQEKKLNQMAVLVNGIKKLHNNYGYGYGYNNSKSKIKKWFS